MFHLNILVSFFSANISFLFFSTPFLHPCFLASTSASDPLLLEHQYKSQSRRIGKLRQPPNQSFTSFAIPRSSFFPTIMLSFLILGLFCLTGIGRAQMDPGCVATSLPSATVLPTTVSSCTLFFTPSMPPQIGPTSTVYATMMTTQFNVVNCNYCAISNVAQNPVATVRPQPI